MRFEAKFLKKKAAGGVVYVIFESDRPIFPGKNDGNPIGVVSYEKTANAFYQQKPEYRNYIPFNLDELPELSGTPGNPLPPSSEPDYGKLRSQVEQTQRQVDETNQRAQRLMEKLQRRKKR